MNAEIYLVFVFIFATTNIYINSGEIAFWPNADQILFFISFLLALVPTLYNLNFVMTIKIKSSRVIERYLCLFKI